MKNELTLNSENYGHFKDQSDPITLASFRPGDVLVRCKYCHRTYQKVTVESIGGICPGPSCPSGSKPMETEPVSVRHVVLTPKKKKIVQPNQPKRIRRVDPPPTASSPSTSTPQQRSENNRREQQSLNFCAVLMLLSGVGLTLSFLLLSGVCLFGGKTDAFLALMQLVGTRFRLRVLVPLGWLLGTFGAFYRVKLLQLAGRLSGLWLFLRRACRLWKTTALEIIRDPSGTLLSMLRKIIWQEE